jgi:hypothetical protein
MSGSALADPGYEGLCALDGSTVNCDFGDAAGLIRAATLSKNNGALTASVGVRLE